VLVLSVALIQVGRVVQDLVEDLDLLLLPLQIFILIIFFCLRYVLEAIGVRPCHPDFTGVRQNYRVVHSR